MSEVTGFEYDIFISYCHDDNRPLTGSKGWVDQFHETLESWLKHRRGFNQLTIWRDKKLRGNTRFDSAIEAKINSAALFFVLIPQIIPNLNIAKKNWTGFSSTTKIVLAV